MCSEPTHSRRKRKLVGHFFFLLLPKTKWPPSLPPRPCACWARPCGGSALASTPWERLCRGGLRRRREVRGRIGEVDGRGRRCVFLELACVSWPRSPGQAAARFSFRSGEQAERRSMQKGREASEALSRTLRKGARRCERERGGGERSEAEERLTLRLDENQNTKKRNQSRPTAPSSRTPASTPRSRPRPSSRPRPP